MLGIYVRTSREGEKDESPIEQQKRAGIRFAEAHAYRYLIYEDKGVSGYKITDDDVNPFKNRPQFVNLINDIRAGYQVLEAVESEIENIRYGYKRMSEGATLRQLTMELYDKKSLDKLESLRLSRYWYKILRHFVYTGYALNLRGLEVVKKFDDFEIDNLTALNDGQYYIKSVPYPLKIVSIKKWIKVAERLRINRKVRRDYRNKKASKDLATGILKCSECGQRYYSYTHKNKTGDKTYEYVYYKHYAVMTKVTGCTQKKSFIASNVNEIFKLYYFYFYLVFDDTVDRIEESKRMIKAQQLKIQEQIKQFEKNEGRLEKQLTKFNAALDDTEDIGEIKVLARRINDTEEK